MKKKQSVEAKTQNDAFNLNRYQKIHDKEIGDRPKPNILLNPMNNSFSKSKPQTYISTSPNSLCNNNPIEDAQLRLDTIKDNSIDNSKESNNYNYLRHIHENQKEQKDIKDIKFSELKNKFNKSPKERPNCYSENNNKNNSNFESKFNEPSNNPQAINSQMKNRMEYNLIQNPNLNFIDPNSKKLGQITSSTNREFSPHSNSNVNYKKNFYPQKNENALQNLNINLNEKEQEKEQENKKQNELYIPINGYLKTFEQELKDSNLQLQNHPNTQLLNLNLLNGKLPLNSNLKSFNLQDKRENDPMENLNNSHYLHNLNNLNNLNEQNKMNSINQNPDIDLKSKYSYSSELQYKSGDDKRFYEELYRNLKSRNLGNEQEKEILSDIQSIQSKEKIFQFCCNSFQKYFLNYNEKLKRDDPNISDYLGKLFTLIYEFENSQNASNYTKSEEKFLEEKSSKFAEIMSNEKNEKNGKNEINEIMVINEITERHKESSKMSDKKCFKDQNDLAMLKTKLDSNGNVKLNLNLTSQNETKDRENITEIISEMGIGKSNNLQSIPPQSATTNIKNDSNSYLNLNLNSKENQESNYDNNTTKLENVIPEPTFVCPSDNINSVDAFLQESQKNNLENNLPNISSLNNNSSESGKMFQGNINSPLPAYPIKEDLNPFEIPLQNKNKFQIDPKEDSLQGKIGKIQKKETEILNYDCGHKFNEALLNSYIKKYPGIYFIKCESCESKLNSYQIKKYFPNIYEQLFEKFKKEV